MKTRNLLIGIPLVLLLLMFQSAFWVPTQKRVLRNTERLTQYLDGTIADAAILNPILNADTASSDVCDQVFEGLLDYDEKLQFRGRLAVSWQIFERAQIWVPAGQDPQGFLGRIQNQLKRAKYFHLLAPLEEKRTSEEGKETIAKLPWRVEVELSSVEQDLFPELGKMLGLNIQGEHNPVVIFELRPDVRFHDGHPFTADDVEFTFQAIMNPKNLSPRTSDYEPVKSLKVLDPHHVEITYKRLYSPAIGTWGIGMLPKHLLNDDVLKKEALSRGLNPEEFSMRQSAFNRHPIGTGPFRFQEWKPDQYIRLVRNDAYWEGPPKLKEYAFRVLPDPLALEMEFYSGTLDGYAARPIQADRLKKDPSYQNFSGLSRGYDYIGYNMRRDLFKDARVRTALGMAIDVEAVIRYLYFGHAERMTGPFLKQTAYYNSDLPPLPYNMSKALDLLKEAGWVRNPAGTLVNEKSGEPFRFTLITNNGNDLRKGIMTVAQQAWADLGIEVSTQTVEWTVFLQKHVNPGNFDAVVLGWSMGIEPDLYQIWHSSQSGPQQLNFVAYNNPRADELILRIRQEYDQQRLIKLCHELHAIIYHDQPYTFLTAGQWTMLLDKNFVRKLPSAEGFGYARITPTQTGRFNYYFNQWVKLDPAQADEIIRTLP